MVFMPKGQNDLETQVVQSVTGPIGLPAYPGQGAVLKYEALIEVEDPKSLLMEFFRKVQCEGTQLMEP